MLLFNCLHTSGWAAGVPAHPSGAKLSNQSLTYKLKNIYTYFCYWNHQTVCLISGFVRRTPTGKKEKVIKVHTLSLPQNIWRQNSENVGHCLCSLLYVGNTECGMLPRTVNTAFTFMCDQAECVYQLPRRADGCAAAFLFAEVRKGKCKDNE